MKSYLILIFVFAISTGSAAGKSNSSIFIGYRQPLLDVEIDDRGKTKEDDNRHRILYQPPFPHIAVLGVTFYDFTLGISKDLSEDITKSDYHSFRLSWYRPSIGLDFDITEFKRFDIVESDGFTGPIAEDETFLDDMVLSFQSMRLFYFPLSFGYDLEAAFDPAIEKNSGLALGTVLTLHQFKAHTRNGLIPASWQAEFGSDAGFLTGTIIGSDLELTLAGTLEFRHLFITGLLGYGFGKHEFSYETTGEERSGSGSSEEITWKLAAGYSGKIWYLVANLAKDEPSYDFHYMSISAIQSDVSLVLGLKL